MAREVNDIFAVTRDAMLHLSDLGGLGFEFRAFNAPRQRHRSTWTTLTVELTLATKQRMSQPQHINMADQAWKIPAILLSFEHFLGGQCRITDKLTPSLYQRAVVTKAAGTAEALYPIIPVKDPIKHSQVIGLLMCTTGALLAWPKTRGTLWPLGLNTFLTCSGIYSQRRMKMPYWLPVTNLILGAMVWLIENRKLL